MISDLHGVPNTITRMQPGDVGLVLSEGFAASGALFLFCLFGQKIGWVWYGFIEDITP
jgi:hypothetical protein